MPSVTEQWLSALKQADLNCTPKPLLSQRLQIHDMDTAYKIQAQYIDWKLEQGSTILGYKAALTAEAGQRLFAADGPGTGVLFSSGKCIPGVTLKLEDFHRMGLEVEIGYRVNSTITEAVTPETVMSMIGEILPMVEIVDLGYADSEGQQEKTYAVDFMAGNSAAAKFIIGEFENFDGDINGLKVGLSQDGEELFNGQGSDALGDQLDALIFLINQTLAHGYPINSGHYLMTGSLGRLHFAEAGNFVAHYGKFGQIPFSCE